MIRDDTIVTVGFSQCGEPGVGSPRGRGADARGDGEARRAALSLAASRTRHSAGVQPAPGASLRWTRVSHQVRGLVYTYGTHWRIQGGARDARPPWESKFFHFHAVFGKILKNNGNFGSWRTPLGKILDPPLVLQCHILQMGSTQSHGTAYT